MKFVFRISGGRNCSDPIEDSGTVGPSLITVRMEYLRAFQYWYCELCVENWWGVGDVWIFGGWGVVGWGRKSYLGPAEIVSFSSQSFSHLKQIWFKCEIPLLRSVHNACRRGSQRVLQIFQKKIRSPGDHRPKYFMAQYFFQKIFCGPSHQF